MQEYLLHIISLIFKNETEKFALGQHMMKIWNYVHQ